LADNAKPAIPVFNLGDTSMPAQERREGAPSGWYFSNATLTPGAGPPAHVASYGVKQIMLLQRPGPKTVASAPARHPSNVVAARENSEAFWHQGPYQSFKRLYSRPRIHLLPPATGRGACD